LTFVMALFERRSRHAQLGEPFVVLGERALQRGELRALFLDRIRCARAPSASNASISRCRARIPVSAGSGA